MSQVSEASLQDVAGAKEFVRRYVDYSPCVSTSIALHQVCGTGVRLRCSKLLLWPLKLV